MADDYARLEVDEELVLCVWCVGQVVPGSTCPRSVVCPTCSAGPGRPCRRPSGHRADQLHAGRIEYAERLDQAARV